MAATNFSTPFRTIGIDLLDGRFRITSYSTSTTLGRGWCAQRPILFFSQDCSMEELGTGIITALSHSKIDTENPDYFESTKELVKALKVKSLKYLYDNGKFVNLEEYEKEKQIILMPGEKSSIRGIQYIPERKEVYPSNVDPLVLAKRVKELCGLI